MAAKAKFTALVACALALGLSQTSHAAYVYSGTYSSDLHVDRIYQNEYGSAYIYFTSNISTFCGTSAYLFNLQQPQSQWQTNKLSLALAARAAGLTVRVDWYYDTNLTGWDKCFISGVEVR